MNYKLTTILSKTVVLLAFVFPACSGNVVFNQSQRVADPVWSKDSVAEFNPLLTKGLYQVDVVLRNTDEYRYQNLWLFLTSQTQDSVFTDTLQCFLADDYGRWVGSGIGSIYTNRFVWLDSVAVADSLQINYRVAHGMRHDELSGIKEVGIVVSEIKTDN